MRSFLPKKKPVSAPRRVRVMPGDEIELAGFIIDADILGALMDPANRALWSFVDDGKGRVQPIPYTEDRVIWLSDKDVAVGVD